MEQTFNLRLCVRLEVKRTESKKKEKKEFFFFFFNVPADRKLIESLVESLPGVKSTGFCSGELQLCSERRGANSADGRAGLGVCGAGGQEETAIKCETGLPIHHQTWSLGQWSLNVVPFQLFRLSAISLFFYSTTTTSVARYNTRRPETDRYVYTVQYVMDISPPHTHGRRVDVWLNHRRRQRKRREEEEETGGGRRSARKSPTCQSG